MTREHLIERTAMALVNRLRMMHLGAETERYVAALEDALRAPAPAASPTPCACQYVADIAANPTPGHSLTGCKHLRQPDERGASPTGDARPEEKL